jgi:hypothetical protein
MSSVTRDRAASRRSESGFTPRAASRRACRFAASSRSARASCAAIRSAAAAYGYV